MISSVNTSSASYSPTPDIDGSTGPYDPTQTGSEPTAPTGTGPYAPRADGFDVAPANGDDIFADGSKTVVTCPEGEVPVVTTSGGTATVECKKPKGGQGSGGGGSPAGAPILE